MDKGISQNYENNENLQGGPMNAKQRHQDKKQTTYRETAENHDTRLQAVEQTLHNERLSKYLWRSFVGLMMILGGGFYDQIAAITIKTRFFSFTSSPDIGLAQGIMMAVGALLLLYNAIKYDAENKR